MDQVANGNAGRGSAELWLEAAYESLLEAGVDAVKILPLAKRLNLARTSFYWYFKDREALLEALLARWRDRNTGSIVQRSEAYAETIAEAVLNVFDCWLDRSLFDAPFEFAVRSWAIQSPELQREVQLADDARLAALSRMFQRFGYDEISADVRARTIYLVQIGYISMQSEEALALRMQRIPHYVETFTGRAPETREMNRFRSRHGVSSA